VIFSKIVFNHVPKCGGLSLRYMFYLACLDNKYFSRQPMYIPEYTHKTMCLQENKNIINIIHDNTKIFFDHSHSYFIEEAFNLNIEETFRIINIRNPIKRFVSHMLYFDKIDPNICSYDTLKNKTKEYGNLIINYLSLHKYSDPKIDIETRYNISCSELKKYNFIFNIDNITECISNFNLNNPFDLKLEEQKININANNNIHLSKKTLYNIKQLIELEILLLKDFFPNINENINQY
jgi:hypothetical protein